MKWSIKAQFASFTYAGKRNIKAEPKWLRITQKEKVRKLFTSAMQHQFQRIYVDIIKKM